MASGFAATFAGEHTGDDAPKTDERESAGFGSRRYERCSKELCGAAIGRPARAILPEGVGSTRAAIAVVTGDISVPVSRVGRRPASNLRWRAVVQRKVQRDVRAGHARRVCTKGLGIEREAVDELTRDRDGGQGECDLEVDTGITFEVGALIPSPGTVDRVVRRSPGDVKGLGYGGDDCSRLRCPAGVIDVVQRQRQSGQLQGSPPKAG